MYALTDFRQLNDMVTHAGEEQVFRVLTTCMRSVVELRKNQWGGRRGAVGAEGGGIWGGGSPSPVGVGSG